MIKNTSVAVKGDMDMVSYSKITMFTVAKNYPYLII